MYQQIKQQQPAGSWDAARGPYIQYHHPCHSMIESQQIYPFPYDPQYGFHLDQQYYYASQHQFQYPNQGAPLVYMNSYYQNQGRSYLPVESRCISDCKQSQQQQYHQQHQQQVYQSAQGSTQVQPVLSTSSITSSPKIVLTKIEEPSGFHTEAELCTKQLQLNPCIPPSENNATQQTSRSNNVISYNQEDLKKTQDYFTDIHLKIEEIPGRIKLIKQVQPKEEFKQLKEIQPKEEYLQNQEAAQLSVSFKSLNNDESSTKSKVIQIILNGVERQQAIDHSLYLELPSILSNPDNLSHFRRLFLLDQQQQKESNISQKDQKYIDTNIEEITSTNAINITSIADINLLNSNKKEHHQHLLVPYDRIIKQRIFEVQQSNPDLSYSNNLTPSNSSLPTPCILATNIQKTFQTSNNISRISCESSSVIQSLNLNPKKKYKIYTHLQKMCETFIRGDKKKRFKERNPQSQYMSQFHNLNRLFFYQIMSIYSYESLSCFEIDSMVSEALRSAVNFVKIHSKLRIDKISNQQESGEERSDKKSKKSTENGSQLKKKVRKNNNSDDHHDQRNCIEIPSNDMDEDQTENACNLDSRVQQSLNALNIFTQSPYKTVKVENYTHAHYNTLFLKLTPESMAQLQKHSKDIESHWLSYKIDLRKPGEIAPEKIIFVNLLKALFYKIFVHFNNVTAITKESHFESVMNIIKQSSEETTEKDEPVEELDSLKLRLDYYQRVVLGIHKLKEGIFLHKF